MIGEEDYSRTSLQSASHDRSNILLIITQMKLAIDLGICYDFGGILRITGLEILRPLKIIYEIVIT